MLLPTGALHIYTNILMGIHFHLRCYFVLRAGRCVPSTRIRLQKFLILSSMIMTQQNRIVYEYFIWPFYAVIHLIQGEITFVSSC